MKIKLRNPTSRPPYRTSNIAKPHLTTDGRYGAKLCDKPLYIEEALTQPKMLLKVTNRVDSNAKFVEIYVNADSN